MMTYYNEVAGYAPPLIYLHLPKTAGQSLIASLCAHYPPKDALALYLEPNLTFMPLNGFEHKIGSHIPPRLVVGHFSYGVPQRLLGTTAYRWITFLRHPFSRTLSNYLFDHSYLYCSNYESERDAKALMFSTTPSYYINTVENWVYDNCMTRMLSGIGPNIPIGQLDVAILEMAKSNLASFFYVGFQEYYSNCLKQLGEKLCVSGLREFEKNRSPQPSLKGGISIDELAKISQPSERNIYDLQLYYWALHRFMLPQGELRQMQD